MTSRSVIPLDHEDAETLMDAIQGEPIETDAAGTFELFEELPDVIAQYRWASIRRTIYRRGDMTFWALDWEYSDTEAHEPWSYIQPSLKPAVPVEKMVTVWTVQA